jgi:hypothetical protein
VCGTIDIEKALTEGVKAFEPGLLAKANRGILYVDEVSSGCSLCCIVQLWGLLQPVCWQQAVL